MDYNGIVNSNGAADVKSAALFGFVALIPYTKGCMKFLELLRPLFILLYHIKEVFLWMLRQLYHK